MKQFDLNEINSIPFIDRGRANDIALTILNDDFDLNPILGFCHSLIPGFPIRYLKKL